MTRTPHATTRPRSATFLRPLVVIPLIVLLAMYVSSTASLAQESPVGLGTAQSFAVLAGSTITNTGSTTITGDVGLDPGTAVTGFASVTLNGAVHVDDAVAEQAKVALVTAYGDAAGRTPVTTLDSSELGGRTLTGGVYGSASELQITGTLTLDAQGDPATVWVFQAGSTLITATDSNVALINGADACNVYWQVGSDATLGTNSAFAGTIMALTSITLTTGARVQGRVLARNGAVTLDTNVITSAACATPAVDDDTPVDDTPVDDTPVDDTPVDDDASTGEDTPTGGDTPSGGDTTGQIQEVPRGPVATGGGPAPVATSGLWLLTAGVLMLLMTGGTVGAIARRRNRA